MRVAHRSGRAHSGWRSKAKAAWRRGPSPACLCSCREEAPAGEPPLQHEELPPVLAPREVTASSREFYIKPTLSTRYSQAAHANSRNITGHEP